MKATLILAAAIALTTSAAMAQTVAPGAQTGNPSNMPSAGSTTTTTDQSTTTNMSGSDKRAMRKSKKMKSSDGAMKTKTKM